MSKPLTTSTPTPTTKRLHSITCKHGRVKRSFAAETDINNIVARCLATGSMPVPPAPSYVDTTTFPRDLQHALDVNRAAGRVLATLPPQLVEAFRRDPKTTLLAIEQVSNKLKADGNNADTLRAIQAEAQRQVQVEALKAKLSPPKGPGPLDVTGPTDTKKP